VSYEACSLHGVSPGTPSAGRVACVRPVRVVGTGTALDHDFPVANHVVVALDLAQDRVGAERSSRMESGRPRPCLVRSSFSMDGRVGVASGRALYTSPRRCHCPSSRSSVAWPS